MSNPTTPFSWQMPTATDLVTDLPADFEVFGQAVATSMGDLLGGSSGYILSKASATDMDFTWIANDQGDITGVTAGTGISVTSPTGPVPTVAIDATVATLTGTQTLTNKTLTSPALTTPTISTATTNGDILYGTGSGALQRLGIGSASQVLTVASGIPSWATPAGGGGGKVLQVVQGTLTAYSSTTSTTMADTGLTVTITPTLATSKVLVFATCSSGMKNSGNVTTSLKANLLRGATTITTTGDANGWTNSNIRINFGTMSLNFLDSPATTSATTYKVQFASTVSGQEVAINDYASSNTAVSTIIVLEIGA